MSEPNATVAIAGSPAAFQMAPTFSVETLEACERIYGLDTASSVHFDGDRVFRVINPGGLDVIRDIADRDLFKTLEEAGVVPTRLVHDVKDEEHPRMILEHARIPFVTHPAEWTPRMVQIAARFMVSLSLELHKHGLMLKDNHLLNVTFHYGTPVFLDFGSISFYDRKLARSWLNGFRARVMTAIWAARWRSAKFANLMLRSEPKGLGFELSSVFPGRFLPPWYFIVNAIFETRGWEAALRFLGDRLKEAPYRKAKSIWDDYGKNLKEEKDLKRRVLIDEILRTRPSSVHELAGNQAVIGEAIAREAGIPVCSSDFVAECVHSAHTRTAGQEISLQTALLDIIFPTPPYGAGSCRPGAVERLKADTTLATALIHHLVALDKVSMPSFASMIADYSSVSTIVEWVDPTDKYLVNWQKDGKRFPKDYTLESFMEAFSRIFPHVRELPAHHETRRLFHFSRVPFDPGQSAQS